MTRTLRVALAFFLAGLSIPGTVPIRAQSLADVAREEEARRKEVKRPSKVYTNKDLGSVPPPAEQAAPPPTQTDAAKDKTAAKDEKAAADGAVKEAANGAAKEKPRDQAYWSARMKELQLQLDRDKVLSDAMQSRINALTADFSARDDPVQRAKIGSDRQRALEELERLGKAIISDQKAIADLQEEARRASVPPRLAALTVRSRPPAAPPILIVEDKDSLRTMLRLALEAQGHVVIEARDYAEAVAALQTTHPAIVLSDLRLPDGDGLGVLRAAKETDPELPVVVMTAFANVPDAVVAMKEGALDFLAKPVDPDHLMLIVERALATRRLTTENMLLKEELAARRGAPKIVGEDPRLKQVSVGLHRAAATDMTVLLEGESGTGKELFARALHALSPRAEGPFVAINCAAIPDNLLETELFGYEKGAFTGAATRKLGKFEVAHRGTLFLDEIGDLPLTLQPKILRALETKQYERVGGMMPLQVDVRVVAATNRNLRAAVAARRYREDLFFRLSVFPIVIPPLRERVTDIPILARHFVERYSRDLNRKPLMLSASALEQMVAYPWPGNVRELQNCMERAVILSDGDTIHARHLSLTAHAGLTPRAEDRNVWDDIDMSGSLAEVNRRMVAEVEARKIEATLKEMDGDRGRTADALQIGYKLLLEKIKEYGLS